MRTGRREAPPRVETGSESLSGVPEEVLILELLQLVQVKSSQLLLPLQSLLVSIPLSPTNRQGCGCWLQIIPDQNISAGTKKPASGTAAFLPNVWAVDAMPLLSTRWQQRLKATFRSSFIFHVCGLTHL